MENLSQVVENYDRILEEVKSLSQGNATLVLASKTVDQSILKSLAKARPGVIFGENKVQELIAKYFEADGLVWQFIGRLQTNKVKYIVDKVSLIQSVDSLRLAEEIEKRAGKIGKRMDILVEVNVGGEASKGGVEPDELLPLLSEIAKMPHLKVKGLMSVLPNADEAALAPCYALLKDLFEKAKAIEAPNFSIEILSAGMSGDYRFALQNGSNMVRIGSAVFGARSYAK